jgi:hypothetical protein
VEQITLHRIRLPLHRPYYVSCRVYDHFEPIIAELRDGEGRSG